VIVLPVPKNASRCRVDGLAFGPDGRSLAAAGSVAGLQLWDDIHSDRPPRTFKHPEPAQLDGPVEFRTDGRFVMCRSDRGPVIWSLDGSHLVTVPPTHFGVICRASFTPGDSLLVTDYKQNAVPYFGVIELRPLFEPTADRAVWSHPTLDIPGQAPIVAEDGATFAAYHAAIADSRRRRFAVVTHDLATGRILRTSGPGPEKVGLSSVGLRFGLLVQISDRQISAWKIDVANDWQQPFFSTKNDQKRNVTDVAFHPSGRYLAATSNDATVKLYDTTTWEVARTFTWDIGRMRSIAFSPDGTLAAAGSDKGKVVVWDVDL
jgi:WD40 repeat protein